MTKNGKSVNLMARSKSRRATAREMTQAKVLVQKRLRYERGVVALPKKVKVPGAVLASLSQRMPRVPKPKLKRLVLQMLVRRQRAKQLLDTRAKKIKYATLAKTLTALTSGEEKRMLACRTRATRKAVLHAIGRVTKPGGAPGPYKRKRSSKERC